MEAAEFILYVAGQARAAAFYRHVLAAEPVLDVPGMTEFSLDRAAAAGGKGLDGLRDRSWGERVGYALDPDGHVLAFAVPAGLAGESC